MYWLKKNIYIETEVSKYTFFWFTKPPKLEEPYWTSDS